MLDIKIKADDGNPLFAEIYASYCESMGNIVDAIKYYEIAASFGLRASKRSANMLKAPDQRLKVKQPYFFKVKYNGKTAYLLGTVHIIGWDVFPSAMQDIIRSCKGVISEHGVPSVKNDATQTSPRLSRYILAAKDLDWFLLLPPVLQDICSKIWLSNLGNDSLETLTAANIKVTIAKDIISGLTRDDFIEALEDILETKYHNIRNIYGVMDYDIQDVLEVKGGLEEAFTTLVLSENCEEEDAFAELIINLLIAARRSIDEQSFANLRRNLEKSLSPLLSKSTNFRQLFNTKICAEKSYNGEYLKKYLLDFWERYASGAMLYDLSATLTNEQNDIDGITYKRNAIMGANALGHITVLPEPILIKPGLNHLLGRNGLLTTLAEAGAELELYDCKTNSFIPYVYPYKYYLKGLESIKQGMFFSPTYKSNCTAITPYTSQEQFLARFKPRLTM